MRNALAVLILLCVSAVPSLAQVPPEVNWKSENLKFRSTSTAGIVDSFLATYSAGGELDTTAAISVRSRVHLSVPDSSQFVTVWIQTISPVTGLLSGFDSADSIYVAVDGSSDNGVTWRTLTDGIGINGFRTGSAMVGSSALRAITSFNGKPNSTTNVLGRSPVIIPTSNYGGWFGWNLLRLRFMGSAAAFQSPIQCRAFITYPADGK